ncbi:MAG: S-methyl-5-thioribose-1-phosphate isomerase [Deltaproteobacteria bacterium]|nr:S-methyl-5-thioribose-1-phosphate isomerase [Deltaproteobacteria bacterium]MDZ4224838.1 S-methyl-5-thioribose-1-phosphate isomerase [bacterium]
MYTIKTIEWKNDKVILLDQRLLPQEEAYITCDDYLSVAKAIEHMAVRGAPAIGVAAAMGVALGALGISAKTFGDFYKKLEAVCERLAKTRPTAVNLFWALERMKRVTLENKSLELLKLQERLKEEAIRIFHEDIEINRMIGKHGSALLKDGMRVLTHCNAGALATAGFGTALGVIYAAQEEGKRIHVYADETRPWLQGARLTTWELQKHGVETTLICDNMAASLMAKKEIDCVIVGADRIAANGDVVNKIGTYSVAVLAKHHNIPFYVAAPTSTMDPNIKTGADIPIEERDAREVTHIRDQQIAPTHIHVINPAFDCTPHELITAIITEKGLSK